MTANHERTRTELIFQMRRQPAHEPAVVQIRFEMKGENAKLFDSRVVRRNQLAPNLFVAHQCNRLLGNPLRELIQREFIKNPGPFEFSVLRSGDDVQQSDVPRFGRLLANEHRGSISAEPERGLE